MEGGDFLALLLAKAPLTEQDTRFYLAEMINAIDACHKLGCMHRDIKVRDRKIVANNSLITFFSREMDI